MADRGWSDLRLPALLQGDKPAWDAFVERYSGVIYSAIHSGLAAAGRRQNDSEDVFQDVFVRLAANDYRLLRRYDASRAKLSTWLTVIARSVALNSLRRRQLPLASLDAAANVPDDALRADRDRIDIPDQILTPRQKLVMAMTYDDDLTASEIARKLGIDPQTVRSTRHKALERLRAHFREG